MKSNYKILGTIALAAIGASMAHATAVGYGDGYASASYYESSTGLYYTAQVGNYNGYGYSYVGSNWYGVDYLNYDNGFYNSTFGESVAYDTPGAGSGFFGELYGEGGVTISNLSSHYDTLYVYAYTYGFGEGYSSSWNNYGEGEGVGEFFDSAGLIEQYSEGFGAALGRGYGGDYAAWENYDIYNGYTSGFGFFGNVFPGYAYGYSSDYQLYTLYFAPGASDTFYTYSYDAHVAYATTPAPAAIAPFALGLIGALRRRKRA